MPSQDRIGRKTERGQIHLVEPSNRALVLQFYDGLLKVLPCERGFRASDRAFNLRLEETDVIDITFLHKTASPTLAVLYRDQIGSIHLKTYLLSLADKTLVEGSWQARNLRGEPVAVLPVPAPIGGCIIIGRRLITYRSSGNKDDEETCPLATPINVRAHCAIDGYRFLIGDSGGGLHLLVLKTGGQMDGSSAGAVTGLEWQRLGVTTIASTMQYLDAGVVYVGSVFGDPQVIKLKDTADPATGYYFDVLSTYPNLGPIVDMAVIDLDRQGQGAVVTCSGVGKEGSLRVVRNGVGIEQQAVVDLPGIRGLWSLKPSSSSQHDKYLLQSYASETRVFVIEGDAMDEVEMAGFKADAPTLFAASMDGDTLLQVTANEARLVSGDGAVVLNSWSPPSNARITVANGGNGSQVLVALSGGVLVYLDVEAAAGGSKQLVQRAQKQMPHEVSCISISQSSPSTSVGGADGDVEMEAGQASASSSSSAAASSNDKATIAAVGLWTDITVRTLHLPDLSECAQESLGGDIPSRSLLLTSMEGVAYALVGLGDGHLFTFRVDPASGALSDRKKVQLGRQPIALSMFRAKGSMHVFAACDRPTVLFSMSRKLVFSNVNLGEVHHMAPFNSPAFPDCLALATPTTLEVGTVDDIQKLHVKSIHIGEEPRRIGHYKAGKVLVVATQGLRRQETSDSDGGGGAAAASSSSSAAAVTAVEVSSLRLFDDSSYEPVPGSTFDLDPQEVALSVGVVSLGGGGAGSASGEGAGAASSSSSSSSSSSAGHSFIVVGTAYILGDEEEPSKGRVLVLSVTGDETSRRLHLVCQREMKGGVFAVAGLAGGKLVAAVNSKVQVYRWTGSGGAAAASSSSAVGSAAMDIDADGGGAAAGASSSSSSAAAAAAVPTGDLHPECGYHGHTLALYLDTRGDFILVGDLMKSITLLRYNPVNSSIEEAAAEPGTNWMSSVAMIDDNTFIGAETHHNLFTAVRYPGAATEEERLRLDITGEFHSGEFINRFRQGSLVMLPQEAEDTSSSAAAAALPLSGGASDEADGGAAAKRPRSDAGAASSSSSSAAAAQVVSTASVSSAGPRPKLIFGCISGAIGVLISLPPPLYRYLHRVQTSINRVMHGVGGLSHSSYRSFYSEHMLPNMVMAGGQAASEKQDVGPTGFLDGDLLELFLDLERSVQEKVINLLNGKSANGQAAAAAGAGAGSSSARPLYPGKATAKHPNGSTDGEATLEELVKVIEDLSRLH